MKAMEAVPEQEIECRIRNLQLSLQEMDLDGAFILQNVDLFYFSGTIQSSVLFIPQQGEPALMVQKAIHRRWPRAQVFAELERTNPLELITVLASMAILPISFVHL
jgi:hypothetical protein